MEWELGEPETYVPAVVPLCRARIWPESLTRNGDLFARTVERFGSTRLGAVTCNASHDFESLNASSNVDLWTCLKCGAAV